MAGVGRFFGRYFGRTIGDAASFGIGGSISRTIDPVLLKTAQEAWQVSVKAGISKVPGAGELAAGIASGQITRAAALAYAAQDGYGSSVVDALTKIADEGPGVAAAMELWRRGFIDEAGFRRAAKRDALEAEWIDALVKTKPELLSPAELANAVVQGHRDFDTAAADALRQGVDGRDFQTIVDNTGLPPGPETLLEWLRRGIIDRDGLAQGIREGHTKVKYIDRYLDAQTRVLSAIDYAGLRLRGWITPEESYSGGALTGYSREQMDMLFLNRGRPATTHQVHLGYARGGRYIGEGLDEREAFSRAIKNSDIRPEYEDILWAQRYTYPSAFVLRALVSDGTFTAAQGRDILVESGWRPDLAELAATKWGAAKSGGAKDLTAANLRAEYEGLFITRAELVDGLVKLGYSASEGAAYANLGDAARVKSARDHVLKSIHDAYTSHEIQNADAVASMTALGISSEAIGHLIPLWTAELAATRKRLTPAQIGTAYRRATLSQADALIALGQYGYSDAEARSILGLALPVLTVKQIQDALKADTITYAKATGELKAQGYNDQQVLELLGPEAPPTPPTATP